MASGLLRYVALGDSTAVGVGAGSDGGYPERLFRRLKAEGFPVGILNLGQSGATSAEAVAQAQRASSKRPHLVTLGIGTNDLWRMGPAATFAANLGLIAEQLERCGAWVVVANLTDLTLAPARAAVEGWGISLAGVRQRVETFNGCLNALAQRPRFSVVDLFSASQEQLPSHPEYFCPDGFHPSAAGYDLWTELMWPAVQRAARGARDSMG